MKRGKTARINTIQLPRIPVDWNRIAGASLDFPLGTKLGVKTSGLHKLSFILQGSEENKEGNKLFKLVDIRP